jgi:hypothetical protein
MLLKRRLLKIKIPISFRALSQYLLILNDE